MLGPLGRGLSASHRMYEVRPKDVAGASAGHNLVTSSAFTPAWSLLLRRGAAQEQERLQGAFGRNAHNVVSQAIARHVRLNTAHHLRHFGGCWKLRAWPPEAWREGGGLSERPQGPV